ncbi:hypothetical protein V5O48_002468 [Marasmius crinis-equi]|uniref:C2H2-type domain-containing protein n=1 Tax=Marasmius crinis-equi TaxID=585013 RepID=A0ABR3FVJ0_9AGAR
MTSSRSNTPSDSYDDVGPSPPVGRGQALRRVTTLHPRMGGDESLFRSSTQPPATTAPTLGVFHAKTATYRWPPLIEPLPSLVEQPGRVPSGGTPPSSYLQDIWQRPQGVAQRLASTSDESGTRPSSAGSSSDAERDTQSPPLSNGVPEESNEWLSHAAPVKDANGPGADWQCTWKDPEGVVLPCAYRGKKQLVKRHIITTHLNIKKFVCVICDKRFAQSPARAWRSNLNNI